jgi:hypothetical protein
MPERDVDEILGSFERLTDGVNPPVPRRSSPPGRSLLGAAAAVVLLGAVVGTAVLVAPRSSGPAGATTINLPTHRELNAYPAALLVGKLVLDNDCVYAEHTNSKQRDLIVWPSGTTLQKTDSESIVVGSDGERIAAIGEPIELGGGEFVPRSDVMENAVPDGCLGPYWLAASATSALGEPRPASWRLAPFEPVNPDTTTLGVFVTEQGCETGLRFGSAVGEPEIDYRPDAVVLNMTVRSNEERCAGGDSPTRVQLTEPIGLRNVVDGTDGSIEWQPLEGLVSLPLTHQPLGVSCYPMYLEGAFLAGDPTDPAVAWVVSATGQRVEVLWPVGYSARFAPELELIGPINQVIARAGDELTLGGGFVPSGEWDTCEVAVGPLDIGGDPLPWPTTFGPITTAPTAPPITPRPSPVAPAPTPVMWQEPDAYAFTMDSQCGERALIGQFRVHVENGRTVAVEIISGYGGSGPIPPAMVPTLADLLRLAADARNAGAYEVSVLQDPTDGHPMSIAIDPEQMTIDDEQCYEISEYTRADSGALPAHWRLDAAAPISPDTTEIHILVEQTACVGSVSV